MAFVGRILERVSLSRTRMRVASCTHGCESCLPLLLSPRGCHEYSSSSSVSPANIQMLLPTRVPVSVSNAGTLAAMLNWTKHLLCIKKLSGLSRSRPEAAVDISPPPP